MSDRAAAGEETSVSAKARSWDAYRGLEFRLRPGSTALLVVDVQRKTCDPDVERGTGALLRARDPQWAAEYFGRVQGVSVPNIQALIRHFRSTSMPVLFFTIGPTLPDASDMPAPMRAQYCGLHMNNGAGPITTTASEEFKIIDEVAPQPGELVLNKVTRSGFCGTSAEPYLRGLGVRSLVISGGATHACVDSTARHASDLGFETVLVEDACHSVFPELHRATMTTFGLGTGRVLSTKEVVAELSEAAG